MPRHKPKPPQVQASGVTWVNFSGGLPPVANTRLYHFLSESAHAPLMSELEEMRDLTPGWEGPGSVAPPASQIDAALAFVRSVELCFRPPEISLASDGEISVYWRNEDHYIDVSFRASGKTSIYVRSSEGTFSRELGRPSIYDVPRLDLERLVVA